MTTIAVMQPGFVPYAGYVRLFAASDLLVVFDCVPFPRRGWVHRNRLPDARGRRTVISESTRTRRAFSARPREW